MNEYPGPPGRIYNECPAMNLVGGTSDWFSETAGGGQVFRRTSVLTVIHARCRSWFRVTDSDARRRTIIRTTVRPYPSLRRAARPTALPSLSARSPFRVSYLSLESPPPPQQQQQQQQLASLDKSSATEHCVYVDCYYSRRRHLRTSLGLQRSIPQGMH